MRGFIKMKIMSFSYFILHRMGNVYVAEQNYVMHFTLVQCIHIYLHVIHLEEMLR